MQTRSYPDVIMFLFDVDRIDSVTLSVYDPSQSHTAKYVASVHLQCCEKYCPDSRVPYQC